MPAGTFNEPESFDRISVHCHLGLDVGDWRRLSSRTDSGSVENHRRLFSISATLFTGHEMLTSRLPSSEDRIIRIASREQISQQVKHLFIVE